MFIFIIGVFLMLFSELGSNPRDIKSIGVEIQPKNGKIYFQQILNDEYMYNDDHPMVNGKIILDVEEFHRLKKFSLQELGLLKNAIQQAPNRNKFFTEQLDQNGDLKVFFGKFSLHERDTVYSLLNENLIFTDKLSRNRKIYYGVFHDLYHVIESEAQTPLYVTDSQKVKLIEDDFNDKDLLYKEIFGIDATVSEFTTAFCELQVFNINQVIGFIQTIEKLLENGDAQYISISEQAKRIKKTLLSRSLYQDYKKNAKNIITLNAHNQYTLIQDLITVIKSRSFNLRELLGYFYTTYYSLIPKPYLTNYATQKVETSDIVQLIDVIASAHTRKSQPTMWYGMFSEVHNVPLRFPFLYSEERLLSFRVLLGLLENMDPDPLVIPQSSHSED